MKTLPELQVFFNNTLKPQLEILENERKKAVRNIYAVCLPTLILEGVLVLALILGSIFQFSNFMMLTLACALSFNGLIIIFCVFYVYDSCIKLAVKTYFFEYKTKVVQQTVDFLGLTLEYAPWEGIEKQLFLKSGIFRIEPNRYHGDDLFKGKIGITNVQFSEVHAEYQAEETKDAWHTLFKGLFFVGEFNKVFQGQTFVLNNSSENKEGLFATWSIPKPVGDLVKLEDPEFQELFVVYSTDQIEARYVLSTSLMRRIIDFRKKSGRSIEISFVNSRIHVAIPYRRNLFEPAIFETILNFDPVKQYLEDIQFFMSIVDDLNLNLRIWNKV